MMSTTLVQQWHPAAEAYPMMSGADYERLKESIMRQGVLKPIEVYAGTAFPQFKNIGIDGRNRAKAAAECGVHCPIRALTDEDIGGSITDYITCVNSVRRHEHAGMRAAVAVGLEECFAAEAKEQMRQGGGDKKSAKAVRQRLENPAKSGEEIIPHPIRANQSRDKAAAVCDVNERYVQDAKKLSLEAPSLFQKLKVGAIMLPAAMAALKRKNTDLEAWALLLGGAMSLKDFRARCKLKELQNRKSRSEDKSRSNARTEPVDDTQHAITDEEFLQNVREQMLRTIGEARAELGLPPRAVQKPTKGDAASSPAKVTDSFGRPVPKGLSNVFNDAAALRGYIEALGQLIMDIHRLELIQTGKHFAFHYGRMLQWVESFRQQLEGERPKCVCPICRGAGRHGGGINSACACCKGLGWIGVFNFDRLKPELRTLAENWRDAESVEASGKKLGPAA